MIFRAKGIPTGVNDLIVGVITRNPDHHGESLIWVGDEFNYGSYIAHLSCQSIEASIVPTIANIQALDHLSDGDIVSIGQDGIVRTVYRVNSFYNTILATERCNSNCLMCSQPPKDRNDIPYLFELYRRVIPLIPKDCLELTISGGEPTLMGEYFFELLELITRELPKTDIHILTNGRTFAWNHFAERLAQIGNPRMMLGIPVYADYYQVHDYIVQARGAFDQTILGLHNLARYGIRLEIRVVLHQQSIPRLSRLARYIFKNLPFAEHVTFMGLEYTGYTPHNIEKLWIDPYDYNKELTEAVEFLAGQGMHVSIYNAQLCVMPERLWGYARKSISDWKNDYLPACQACSKLHDCGGLFTWNLKKCSAHIQPVFEDVNLLTS
ncbi:His-Xaa-Ser system radical SAM maturase HxsC [Mucilaginibacter corticis]|uniref:His-Xaa-Ser system radical SAM maturase HxsC n=1 Tax=Mucilaginibacter corticis TaxID=2597670 RepID=A0A556M4W2_9SPHI|nr:His-Xaa-Ser system radical SAM maturase HxsC [Mucilaginibacter corticis]TSJ34919.1 His-Xaa-Ser system radical SAM maturase HxsC [Mucilaginibacter corticis]